MKVQEVKPNGRRPIGNFHVRSAHNVHEVDVCACSLPRILPVKMLKNKKMSLLSLLTTLNYSPQTKECQGFSHDFCREPVRFHLYPVDETDFFSHIGTKCLLITFLQSAKIFIANAGIIHRDMHIIHRQEQYFHRSFRHFLSLYKEKLFPTCISAISVLFLPYRFLRFSSFIHSLCTKMWIKLYRCA